MKIEANEINDDYDGELILMLKLSSKLKVMICLFALLYFIIVRECTSWVLRWFVKMMEMAVCLSDGGEFEVFE